MNPSDTYDVIVIGGGIAGAGVARDAALRGLSVLLLEKGRFGSGTSSKSSKLIHGGLRYLETSWSALCQGRLAESWLNLRFVFDSLRECRTLARLAPGLVRPLELTIPLYRGASRSRPAVFAGCLLYWLLSVFGGGGSPMPRMLSAGKVLERLPGLRRDRLMGGVLIQDHTTDDRALVQATIESARHAGAEALEETAVGRWHYDAVSRLYAVSARRAGGAAEYRCRKLVNASGPWIDRVRETSGDRDGALLYPLAGSHLHFKRFLPHSAILSAVDGRVFFVINVGDVARVGTTERPSADPDAVAPSAEEVDYLLRSLADYFPDAKLGRADILSMDAGIRPLARPRVETSPREISREHEVRVGPDGVIHMLGVKLTDHRRAAEEIVDSIAVELRRIKPGIRLRSVTAKIPL